MIVISRDLARRFRAVAKKCVSGRPRGPAAPVVLQSRSGTLTLATRAGVQQLDLAGPGRQGEGAGPGLHDDRRGRATRPAADALLRHGPEPPGQVAGNHNHVELLLGIKLR